MSVPYVSQKQIDDMNHIAATKYGIKKEEVVHEAAPVQEAPIEDVAPEQEDPVDVEQEGQDKELEVEETAYAAPAVESSKEQNLRFLRERAEKAEREREEMMKYVMSLQQNQQAPAQKQQPVQEEPDFSFQIDDDALIEGKHAKQLAQEIASLKKTLKNYEQQTKRTALETVEMRLQTQFPDFNKVVTHDNLVKLRQINPDLADTILRNNDEYKQAKLAYEMVKQFGIYQDETSVVEQALAKRYVNKPRPTTSISPTKSDSPISRVNAFANAPLTKEVKQAHYEEMLQAMKGM
jgi:hypothetical protein